MMTDEMEAAREGYTEEGQGNARGNLEGKWLSNKGADVILHRGFQI